MFYIANCTLETTNNLGNEMDLVSKVSGMKSTADSVRATTSSVQITGLRNTSVNVQARQAGTGPNSGNQAGGNANLNSNQITSHIVPISQSSVKQVSSTNAGGATLTLIQSSAVGSGGGSTPGGGLVLTRPHLSSSSPHHVQHHQLHQQSPLISVATGTTYHVPRGAAAVANIAAPRSAVASPIIRASSASGLQVSGGPPGSSGLAGAACVGYTPGGALLRPASSSSATILPRITSPPASSSSTTTVSTPASVATSVVASSGATAWVSSKASTATPVGGAVIVQPQGHHPRGPYSQIRTGALTVTTKMPIQGHRLQVEASPVVRTTSAAATSSSHASPSSISSSSPSIAGIVKQSTGISQHVTQLHIPEKGYFKAGGVTSSGAVTIAQVLSSRVGPVSGLNSTPSSISSSSSPSATTAFPLHFTPVSSPISGRPCSGSSGPSSVSTTTSTTTAPPSGLHGMVSTTRIALAGARGHHHQHLVGPKVIAQPVHGPSSIQITQVPVQVPSSPTTTQQHPVSSSAPSTSSSGVTASQSPQHLPLQALPTQPATQATIHTVVPLSAVHQQQHSHSVQQHQAHQGTAIAITTVVTRALTYTGPAVPGAVVAGQTLGRPTAMLSVPAIPSPSSSIPSTSTTSSSSPLSAASPVASVTSATPGVPVGKVFTSPLGPLSLGRVGLEVTSAGDHPVHQPLVSLQQGQHQSTPGVYIHAGHSRASPAPQITTAPRGERSQVVVGGNNTSIVQQQQMSTSPSPPSTLSSTVPSSTISSTSSTIAVVTTTNTGATYALPTTTYYYGGSGYTVGVTRPFSGGAASGGSGPAVTALPGNAGSSFVPIQAVSAAVMSSTSVATSASSSSVVTVAPASPASLTTIRPVGQPGLTTHQVHGIMTTGSGPVRFNPVMVVDSTRSSVGGAPPFLSEGQYVEVAGAGNGIVGTHFTNSALQPKHPMSTLAPPPAPASASIVSVQASPIKPNSSPRPSILRKRDCDGAPMKAQKNLGPTLAALSSSSSIGSALAASATTAASLAASLSSAHSPPPSPSLGTGNHHSSSSPTSSSSSSSSSSSAGSTTISATSSPGGEVDVGEDSLPPHQLLAPPVPGTSSMVVKTEPVDDAHNATTDVGIGGGIQVRPFVPVPPPTAQVVVEMSPRKKPRKQQLTGNELQEPKFSEDEMEFISEAKIKKEVKNGKSSSISASTSVPVAASSVPIAISAPPPAVSKRPTSMSLLNGYRHAWKSRHNHFIRPGDVRPREERRPSIADIAAQRRVLQKLNGWKVHHLSSQMEELAELEIQVFEKLTEMLGMMERKQPSGGGKELEKDVNRINELIKGNLQRSKVIKDQMQEAKSQVMKIFEHKDLVSDILSKSASKRSAKKREKS